jgi:hypothetical protein
MNSLKILKMAAIAAAVIVIGIAVGWLGTRGSQSASRKPIPTSEPAPAANATSPAPLVTAPSVTAAQNTNSGLGETENASPAATGVVTNWEDRIDTILSGEGEEADKAKKMLELFPHLPEEGQTEVAQHLANLTPDSDYGSLANYLTNAATPESVLDVLMGDLLNRPNSVKLPTLLGVASDSQNPKAGEAKDILELYLEEDYGTDWATWQTKLTDWLKNNPD